MFKRLSYPREAFGVISRKAVIIRSSDADKRYFADCRYAANNIANNHIPRMMKSNAARAHPCLGPDFIDTKAGYVSTLLQYSFSNLAPVRSVNRFADVVFH